MIKINEIVSTATLVTDSCKIPNFPGIYCKVNKTSNECSVECSENLLNDLKNLIDDEIEYWIIETEYVLFVDDSLRDKMRKRINDIMNLIDEQNAKNVEEISERRLTFEELPEVNSERWLSLEDLPGEHWKDCVGFEGKYAVSDYGRVKTLKYTNVVTKHNCNAPFSITVPERIRKLTLDRNDYYYIGLQSKDGLKNILIRINRLVAFAFIPNPNNYPIVDHLSGIKHSNQKENLRWCNLQMNIFNENTFKKISYGVKKARKNSKKNVFFSSMPIIQQDIIDKASTQDKFEDYYFIKSDRVYVNVDFIGEVWKYIANTDNLYEISNYGRVRSSAKMSYQKENDNTKRIKRQHIDAYGYCRTSIKINGKFMSKAIHILLMDTFVGRPKNYEVINHINGMKNYNVLSNLEYCSFKENSNNPATVLFRIEQVEKNITHKRIIQYDIDGNYINDYDSYRDILKIYPELNKENIYNAAQNKAVTNNFQFRYEDDVDDKFACIGKKVYEYQPRVYEPITKYINQYDIYGHFLNKYNNIYDAVDKSGININSLKNLLYNEPDRLFSCGYLWCESDETNKDNIKSYDILNSNNLMIWGVDQYSLEGKFIKHWNNQNDIKKELKCTNLSITNCCKHIKDAFRSYQWVATIESNYVVPNILLKSVSQYKDDGTFVSEYNTIYEASEQTGFSVYEIQRVCEEHIKNHSEYCWFYTDSINKTLHHSKRRKPVLQYSLEGLLIKEWNSSEEAAVSLGKDKKVGGNSIRNCCIGNKQSVYGYQWCYPENADKIKPYKKRKQTNRIRQYTLDGILMEEFEDIYAVIDKYGYNRFFYQSCCRREKESALDCIWRYENDDEFAK